MLTRSATVIIAIMLAAELLLPSQANAYDPFAYGGRQYYSSWAYNGQTSYYYSTYYYRTYSGATTYQYHYAVYFPAQPNYVYYYNPRRRVYWGRLDLRGTEGKQYSLLAEKDRNENIKKIPETAFPEPAAMPKIPEASDDVAMMPINIVPGADIPKAEATHDEPSKELPNLIAD